MDKFSEYDHIYGNLKFKIFCYVFSFVKFAVNGLYSNIENYIAGANREIFVEPFTNEIKFMCEGLNTLDSIYIESKIKKINQIDFKKFGAIMMLITNVENIEGICRNYPSISLKNVMKHITDFCILIPDALAELLFNKDNYDEQKISRIIDDYYYINRIMDKFICNFGKLKKLMDELKQIIETCDRDKIVTNPRIFVIFKEFEIECTILYLEIT